MTARDVTTGSHVTGPQVTGLQVTGTAQRDAWRARVLPPVEQVRPGLWSVPVPIPDNPLRYTLSYAFTGDAGTLIVDPGWESAAGLAGPDGRPGDRRGDTARRDRDRRDPYPPGPPRAERLGP